MKNNSFILISILSIALCNCGGITSSNENRLVREPSVESQKYEWNNVQIVGGGFVDGIIFHPKARDVRFCRTDMGGAYRWDAKSSRWVSMLDWIPYQDLNLVGVESIAVDPNDPLKVYLSCGTNTRANGAVLYSHDGGVTFSRVDMPFGMGGNENGRGNGERMMVDPLNSDIIYLGTRNAGLWRSEDGARSWERVESFPDVTEVFEMPNAGQNAAPNPAMFRRSMGSGVILPIFDPSSGKKGEGCSTIYVGVSLMNRDNLFVSKDSGKTWSPVEGQPTKYRPTHGVLSPDGNLYLTYGTDPGPNRMTDGAVWKYNTSTGEWTDISPVKTDPENGMQFGYAAVSVDAQNPQHIIASTFKRPVNKALEDDIYRSIDGGQTWTSIFEKYAEYDYSNAPYVQYTPLHWMFDIEIDPFDSDHAMFTTGYGGWETFNLSAMDKKEKTLWQVMSTGIDETVPLELLSSPAGPHVYTAIGDYCGFAHFELDRPEPEGPFKDPFFANCNGIDCAWLSPNIVVRVGAVSAHHPEGKALAYSEDYGRTWNVPATLPTETARLGHIAVASDGSTWVWATERAAAYFTTDKGETWTACQGIPERIRIVADRVNPAKFYGLDIFSGTLYVSHDGAANFEPVDLKLAKVPTRGNRGDSRGGQDRVYATPGYENDLWIAAFDGLYHSTDATNFKQLDKVREMHAFGFGKAAPGSDYPALFMVGTVNGIRGFFRSDDMARTWVRINDSEHEYGLVLHICGDPKVYGRVYVGTHGRGCVYGDIK